MRPIKKKPSYLNEALEVIREHGEISVLDFAEACNIERFNAVDRLLKLRAMGYTLSRTVPIGDGNTKTLHRCVSTPIKIIPPTPSWSASTHSLMTKAWV